MERVSTGEIYKISIGTEGRSTLSMYVGQRIDIADKTVTVTAIVEDQNNFYFFNKVRYLVYAKTAEAAEFVWRSFTDLPVSVTYKVP